MNNDKTGSAWMAMNKLLKLKAIAESVTYEWSDFNDELHIDIDGLHCFALDTIPKEIALKLVKLNNSNIALIDQNIKLREALEFYNDQTNWDDPMTWPTPTIWYNGDVDMGDRAKQTLKETDQAMEDL